MIKDQYVVLISDRDLFVSFPLIFPYVLSKETLCDIIRNYYKELLLPKNDFKFSEIFCFEEYTDAIKFFNKKQNTILKK